MIAALWPIESALARDLIIDTFRTARGGNVAIADALAMAMRRHLDGPTPRPLLHPRFWAALVVLGDGSIALDADADAAPRDLGAFAEVDPAHDEEILSARTAGRRFRFLRDRRLERQALALADPARGDRRDDPMGGQGRRNRRRPGCDQAD